MTPGLRVSPALDPGLVKVSALLEDPVVRVESWEPDMPLLTIEEGGVQVDLEFACLETFLSFQRQVAALHPDRSCP